METSIYEHIASLKKEIKELAIEIKASGWKHGPKSRRCRHVLIAYGLLRGVEYERIERPREGNEPDWAIVEEIQHVPTTA
jgi:hypothetical protein